MVSVGILSMQRIYNYGSFLQAFALKKMLEELGSEVQFVDYHPGVPLEENNEPTGIRHSLQKVMESMRLATSMKNKYRYIKYKQNYAKKYFPYLNIDESRNYSPDVDLLVIGSDEVFNCVQANPNVGFSPELFGQGNHAKHLISYAASFGNTTIDRLRQYQVDQKVGTWLQEFDSLSVRDSNSQAIVSDLTGRKPVKHIDPVIAFDYVTKVNGVSQPSDISDKYLLLYGYTGRFTLQECLQIKKLARKRGLKIVCIGGLQHCCDLFIDCKPLDVISYFQGAEIVITDTFHGTILSVITHSQFATIVRNQGYGNSEKLTDLLKTLGLSNQIAKSVADMSKELNRKIDYDSVQTTIDELRRNSYLYLKDELEKCTK